MQNQDSIAEAVNMEDLNIEWMILCDAAQIAGGKLYIMGGGWDRIIVDSAVKQHQMAVAIAIRVPWAETNQRHSLELKIMSEDGKELAMATAQFEIGRPAGMPAGTTQRAQFVLSINLDIINIGQYSIAGFLDGKERARVNFSVVAGPMYKPISSPKSN